jgi:4-amino-4-deoxy-L-arabinose transferase-like glycosyltransferase
MAMVIYLILACMQLSLPGLNYDEALDAVPAMQFVLGEPVQAYHTMDLFGRDWPLMVMPYIGPSTTYLLILVFAAFGPGVIALRATGIALGAVSLFLAWGTTRALFGEKVAGVSAMLLACSPSFVFWTRMPAYVALPVVPLALGTVWAGWRWYQGAGDRFMVGGIGPHDQDSLHLASRQLGCGVGLPGPFR